MKRKLGLSVELMGAVTCFFALFGGYLTTIIWAGYILLFEDDEWLKRLVVKAVGVSVFFSILSNMVGLLTDTTGILEDTVRIFARTFQVPIISNFASMVNGCLHMVEKLILLAMGFSAMGHHTVSLPIIDGITDAQFNRMEGKADFRARAAVRQLGQKVCIACGKSIDQDAVFCPECGARSEGNK